MGFFPFLIMSSLSFDLNISFFACLLYFPNMLISSQYFLPNTMGYHMERISEIIYIILMSSICRMPKTRLGN